MQNELYVFIKFADNSYTNSGSHGLYIDGPNSGTITGSTFSVNGGAGLYSAGDFGADLSSSSFMGNVTYGMNITGDYQSAINFGGGPLVSAGLTDIFVVKYDTNGTHMWSQGFPSHTAR